MLSLDTSSIQHVWMERRMKQFGARRSAEIPEIPTSGSHDDDDLRGKSRGMRGLGSSLISGSGLDHEQYVHCS